MTLYDINSLCIVSSSVRIRAIHLFSPLRKKFIFAFCWLFSDPIMVFIPPNEIYPTFWGSVLLTNSAIGTYRVLTKRCLYSSFGSFSPQNLQSPSICPGQLPLRQQSSFSYPYLKSQTTPRYSHSDTRPGSPI